MNAIVHSGILEGSIGHMTFSNSIPMLTAEEYELYGKFVQWSIYQGGPGIPVLSEDCYIYAVGLPTMDSVEDISDGDAMKHIKRVCCISLK